MLGRHRLQRARFKRLQKAPSTSVVRTLPVLLKSAELAIQEDRVELAQRRLKRALRLNLGRDDEIYLIRSRAFLCADDLSKALQDCEGIHR